MGVGLNLTLLSHFGSRLVAGNLGYLLNNGIMWFDPRPGKPNSVAAGAKALANMAPMMVTDDSGLRLVCGASGGRRILAAVPQVVHAFLAEGLRLQDAIERPRIDFSELPIGADPRLGTEILDKLALTGLEVTRKPPHFATNGYGSVVAAARTTDGWYESGVDPNSLGEARAVNPA